MRLSQEPPRRFYTFYRAAVAIWNSWKCQVLVLEREETTSHSPQAWLVDIHYCSVMEFQILPAIMLPIRFHELFLHVRCSPASQFDKQFWACVCVWVCERVCVCVCVCVSMWLHDCVILCLCDCVCAYVYPWYEPIPINSTYPQSTYSIRPQSASCGWNLCPSAWPDTPHLALDGVFPRGLPSWAHSCTVPHRQMGLTWDIPAMC